MICEICGKRPSSNRVVIEGAEIEVCSHCVNTISKDTPDTYRHKDSQRKIERTKISRIVRDAKDIIQQYMRNRGLDMKSLSSVSGVSERDIRSIMERKLIDLNTIRKLERVIGKNLVEEEIITELVSTDDRRSDSRATLGDFVESDGK